MAENLVTELALFWPVAIAVAITACGLALVVGALVVAATVRELRAMLNQYGATLQHGRQTKQGV